MRVRACGDAGDVDVGGDVGDAMSTARGGY